MHNKQRVGFIFLIIIVSAGSLGFFIIPKKQMQNISPLPVASPTPFVFQSYTAPQVSRKDVYKIVMIGDSMTAALGPHGGGLAEYMNEIYKESKDSPQRIVIDNYARSSSILTVGEQLTEKTVIQEYTFEPLLSQDFDLILIESFGYNPLSQFGVEEGIKRQTVALNELMKTLITTKPNARIVFVATIAPNRASYGRSVQPNSTVEGRSQQADERIAYIKNHIAYAQSHNIPVINIFEKSLSEKGDGQVRYINPNDNIHPSFAGVEFIGQEIAHYIRDNNILPL